MEFVSPAGLRVDGRRPAEVRRLSAQLGVLSSADGSAIFEMGNTKVLQTVLWCPTQGKHCKLTAAPCAATAAVTGAGRCVWATRVHAAVTAAAGHMPHKVRVRHGSIQHRYAATPQMWCRHWHQKWH